MGRGSVLARAVSIKVKPGFEVELTRILEQDVITLFQRERDFLGVLAFIHPDENEALSLSLWERKESEGADCPASLSALPVLAGVGRGNPTSQVYRVSKFTLRTMKKVLAGTKDLEANADVEVYQACAAPSSIIARTVHTELLFPGSAASYELDGEENSTLCRNVRTRASRGKRFKNESHASGGKAFLRPPGLGSRPPLIGVSNLEHTCEQD